MGFGSSAALHAVTNTLPLVLLLAAPVFILLGIAFRERGRALLSVALVVMLLGTTSLMLAVATGNDARNAAGASAAASLISEEHQRLAEDARNTFLVATLVFCAVFLVLTGLQARISDLPAALSVAFLVFYALGVFILLDTVRHGLRLATSTQ